MAWNVLINDSDCEWIKSMSSFRLGPTPKANGWLGMNDYSCKMIMSESSRWAHLDLDRPPKASLGWLFLLFKQLTVAGLFADETFLDSFWHQLERGAFQPPWKGCWKDSWVEVQALWLKWVMLKCFSLAQILQQPKSCCQQVLGWRLQLQPLCKTISSLWWDRRETDDD